MLGLIALRITMGEVKDLPQYMDNLVLSISQAVREVPMFRIIRNKHDLRGLKLIPRCWL